MSTLVSVVIPAYNIAPYIGRCLDSILCQSYTNLQIIVVNDGSTDNTGEIIDNYAAKDSRIVAIHKPNGGVSSARLAGIRKASGDFIGFIDGDDYAEPDMYARLVANAVKYNAHISHCGYRMVVGKRTDYYYNTGRVVKQDNTAGLCDLISGEFIEPGLWNKLYHRELFCTILTEDIVPADIKTNEDLLMNYWLFKEAETSVFEDFCPYHYIVRKGSASSAKLNHNKLWDPLRVTEIIMADAKKEVQPAIYRKFVRMLVGGATISTKEDPQLIKPYRTNARKLLHRHIVQIITGRQCGIKLKIMALWAAVWPASYGWVHTMHLKISGLDKIYDIE